MIVCQVEFSLKSYFCTLMLSFKMLYLPRSLHFLHVDSEIIIAIALVPLELLHRNVVCRFEILKNPKWIITISLQSKQGLPFYPICQNIYIFSACLVGNTRNQCGILSPINLNVVGVQAVFLKLTELTITWISISKYLIVQLLKIMKL